MWGGGRADDEARSAANETARDTATDCPDVVPGAGRHVWHARRLWRGADHAYRVRPGCGASTLRRDPHPHTRSPAAAECGAWLPPNPPRPPAPCLLERP